MNMRVSAREIVLLMPIDIDLKLTQIEIDFLMPDSTVKSVITKVTERGKEEEIYEDKIASTKSAITDTFPKLTIDPCFKRYQLGNMPP